MKALVIYYHVMRKVILAAFAAFGLATVIAGCGQAERKPVVPAPSAQQQPTGPNGGAFGVFVGDEAPAEDKK